MITYVDTSTLLKRLLVEEGSDRADVIWEIHLAAAIAIGATVLTSADEALCDAAEHHGLRIANPLDP